MRAVVIGGSNGIGLAITKNLLNRGYVVDILDRSKPDEEILLGEKYTYHYFDLLDLDEDLLSSLADDCEISILMITAGFGRIADFEYFHTAEIKNMMTAVLPTSLTL